MAGETHYIYNISGGGDSSIHDGDTDTTITYDPGYGTSTITVDVHPGDYVEWIDGYYNTGDDPLVPSHVVSPIYVYTANYVWKYAGDRECWDYSIGFYFSNGCNFFENASSCNVKLDEGDGSFYEGSTCNRVIVSPWDDGTYQSEYFTKEELNNTGYYSYGNYDWLPGVEKIYNPITVTVGYGDSCQMYDPTGELGLIYYTYQYPGVWVKNDYPKLNYEPPVVGNWRNLEYPIFDMKQTLVTDFTTFPTIEDDGTVNSTMLDWTWTKPSECGIIVDSWILGEGEESGFHIVNSQQENDAICIPYYENIQQAGTSPMYLVDGTRNQNSYIICVNDELQLGVFIFIRTNYASQEPFSTAYEASNAIYNIIINGTKALKSHVQLKWTDPPDLPDWDPYPCTWEGTVIVRKEDSPPLHRWDGEKIVRTTTRDKYKTEPYKDEDIVSGKTYYYAFMPYYTRYEDPDHPIRFYTFTKVIKVEIGDKSLSSTIDSIDVDGTNATINYTLSQPDGGSFTSIKMYGKIGKNPKCDSTDDIVEDVDSSVTSLTLTGLESGSTYYFCLVTMDTNNKKLSSNVMSCYPFDPVPEEYKSYVNKLNSTTWGASDTYTLLQYSNRRGNSNTWVLDDIYAYTTRDNFNNDSNCYDLIVLSECDIVVTSNNNSVTVNYNYTVAPHDVIQTSGRDMWGTYSQSGNHGDYIQTWGDRSGINFYGQYNVDTITFSLTTSFNSLTDCMSYLTQHFRRINSLKVDGYDWIKK